MANDTCSIDGCTKPRKYVKTGWCTMHWKRWRSNGDPLTVRRIRGNHEARFWSKVDKTDGCWLWTGSTFGGGYGQFWADGKMHYAHRWGYETFVGEVADGNELDHLCREKMCVRFDHLEPVTHKVNILRGESPSALHARGLDCGTGCFGCRKGRI